MIGYLTRQFFIALIYSVAVFLLFNLVLKFTSQNNLLTETSLLNWDAQHYQWIKNNGYEGFRVAFFPLFPFLWKFSGLSVYGITFLNAGIYLSGFTAFSLIVRLNLKQSILILSIPSLIFMFVPYTEALFYLSGVVLLVGLKNKRDILICLGLLFCCLTRPASFVLIPAIIITELLTNDSKYDFAKRSLLFSFFSIIGLLGAFSIQFYYTNEWLSFFQEQAEWDNALRLPSLPFTSWAGGNIVRLDGTALLVGFIALFVSTKWILAYMKDNKTKIQKDLLFSTLYIGGISLLVLMFRGGSLFSLNRFVYATPFFLICFYYFLKDTTWNYKQIGIFILGITLFWLSFNSWVHIQTFLKFGLVSLYLATYLLLGSPKKLISNTAFIICLTGNISLQLYFYYRFLNAEWVG